jgi:hypothetical protein
VPHEPHITVTGLLLVDPPRVGSGRGDGNLLRSLPVRQPLRFFGRVPRMRNSRRCRLSGSSAVYRLKLRRIGVLPPLAADLVRQAQGVILPLSSRPRTYRDC